MWEMIASLFSSNDNQNMMGGASSESFADKQDNLDVRADEGQNTFDKLGQFGKEQFNSAFSPYTNGIADLKNIYSQLKSGNGLLGTNAGSQDPTALSSAARLFSSTGLLGGDSGMAPMSNQMPQITVMQNGGLGMPNANMAPRQNQILPFASNLARQAYGNYL